MSYGMPTLVVGNLTADPELKKSNQGKSYTRVTIANTPRVKDKQTQQWGDGPASFISVTLYDDLAENVAASLTKGTRVVAYGELEKRVWTDNNNQERDSLQLENVTVFAADLRFARVQVARAGQGGGQQRQAPQQGGQQYGPPQGQPQQQYGPPQPQQGYPAPQGQQPQQAFVPQGPPPAIQQPQGQPQGYPAPQQQAPVQGFAPPAGYDPNFAGGSPYGDDTPF